MEDAIAEDVTIRKPKRQKMPIRNNTILKYFFILISCLSPASTDGAVNPQDASQINRYYISVSKGMPFRSAVSHAALPSAQ